MNMAVSKPSQLDEALGEKADAANINVLVVEDDVSVLVSVEKLLNQAGYHVFSADSLSAVWQVLHENTIHVLVADLNLNGEHLYHHFDKIKERANDPVTILFTGEGSMNSAIEAIRVGVYDYLTKPVNPQALLRSVGNAAKIKGLYDEKRMAFRQLQNKSSELETIFNLVDFLIVETDESFSIKSVNRAVATLLKEESGVLIGRNMLEVFYDNAGYRSAIGDIYDTLLDRLTERLEYESELTIAGNEPKRIKWSAKFLNRGDEGQRILHTAEVITENHVLRQRVKNLLADISKKNFALKKVNSKNDRLQTLVRQYTPRSTWQRALETIDSGLQQIPNEKIEACFLFLDIQGFTSFAEHKTPEQVINKLNQLFEVITSQIDAFDGEVDKFIGDAVFAIFAGPLDACCAAISIQNKLKLVSQSGSTEPSLRIRIGLSKGEVIRGNVGGENRKDNTLIGDSVNLASRLENHCKPGGILICERIVQACNDSIQVKFFRNLNVKGRQQNVKTYYLQGAKKRRKR